MAKADCITPFPADVDRDYFGAWLSGFTDGEASFLLFLINQESQRQFNYARASFRIALRADDASVLRRIQSFWGCGRLQHNLNARSNTNANPVTIFEITRTADLATVVIPHFERFPLMAKKSGDFAVWKEGVALLHRASLRPDVYRRSGNQYRGRDTKWTAEEREQFIALISHLRSQRRYDAAKSTPPVRSATKTPLFDYLPDCK